MATEFQEADEAAKLARPIISKHHTHLSTARVDFIFRRQTDAEGAPKFWESKGKRILGKAQVISGLNAFLARNDEQDEQFFVILLDHLSWQGMKKEQREAMLDHYLCRCDVDLDTSKLTTINPDVEEFSAVVERHGLWWADVLAFTERAAKHLPLLDHVEAEAAPSQDVPTISINLDQKCSKCKKKGAAQNGLCLDCIGKRAIKAVRHAPPRREM